MEFAQKLPGRGKLKLRGDKAQAEASATEKDIEDVRLQLTEDAKNAFFDFHLVDRAIEVNEGALRLLAEFKQNAEIFDDKKAAEIKDKNNYLIGFNARLNNINKDLIGIKLLS